MGLGQPESLPQCEQSGPSLIICKRDFCYRKASINRINVGPILLKTYERISKCFEVGISSSKFKVGRRNSNG